MKEDAQSPKAVRIAMIGVFAALYAVLSYIPISVFIGAPSFLALNIILTPVIGVLLSPLDAFLTSIFGGLLSSYLVPSQAMFGPYTILLPTCGATFGSLFYHKGKLGSVSALLFLGLSISAYLAVNYSFPYFVAPHLLALSFCGLSMIKTMTPTKIKVPVSAFTSTMIEQGMMMIFAVYLLGLPWPAFLGILPIMLYERITATIGGTLVIFGLMKALPHYFIEKK